MHSFADLHRTDTEQSLDVTISGMEFLSSLLSKHTHASVQSIFEYPNFVSLLSVCA